MKSFWGLFIILSGLTSCTAQTQKNVDYGFINSEWVYNNAGLNLTYALPKDWHFLNTATKTYIKVGSDIKNIRAYTEPLQVPSQEFKKSNSDQIATLFAISNLDTSALIVSKVFDYNADKTIYFGLVYSDEINSYSFLRKTCSKCTDENFKGIYLKDVLLGNSNFDGYITGVTDSKGRKIGHFFGAKRFGTLYLICQYNFPDMDSFDAYKSYFEKLIIK